MMYAAWSHEAASSSGVVGCASSASRTAASSSASTSTPSGTTPSGRPAIVAPVPISTRALLSASM